MRLSPHALAVAVAATVATNVHADIDNDLAQAVAGFTSPGAAAWSADALGGVCASGSAGAAHDMGEKPPFVGPTAGGELSFGSLTKSMTAVLVGLAVAEGRVPGQKPASEDGWLTTLGEVFPEEAAGGSFANVTLEALAAHRGGFAAQPPTPLSFWDFAVPGQGMVEQRANLTASALVSTPASPADAEYGYGFLYSNWGYVVLGHVAEVAFSASWEDALMERVVAPLGMAPNGSRPFGSPVGDMANWGHFYNTTTGTFHW